MLIKLIGCVFVLLGGAAAASSVLVAVGFSRGHNPGPLLRALDVPYDILMGPFDQTFGMPLFFVYFFGGQALVALALGGMGLFVIQKQDWARKNLVIFSSFNFIVFVLQLGPVMRMLASGRPLTARDSAIILGVIFYALFIIYFTRSKMKAEFH